MLSARPYTPSVADDGREPPATAGQAYTTRLTGLESVWWKRALDVQRPYRWNLQRLHLGRTLDVGCGLGRNLAALADGVGVDHNPASIATARERGHRAWTSDEWPTCADAVRSSFDSMLVAHVLEHLDTEMSHQVLTSYLPYLKDAATLVLICPQERGFVSDPTHIRWVDDRGLADTAASLGFAVSGAYSFPFPRSMGKVFRYNEFVMVARRSAVA